MIIHELTPRTVVREQGAEAFRAGRVPEDNPHWPGSDAHLEWNAGFKNEKYQPARPVHS